MYKERFNAEMVQKLLAPNAPSHGQLARTTGIPQPTLSRWVRAATTLDEVTGNESKSRRGRRAKGRSPSAKPTRRVLRERTAEEKLEIVLGAALG